MEKDKGDENSLWHSYQIIHFLKSIWLLRFLILVSADGQQGLYWSWCNNNTLMTDRGQPGPGLCPDSEGVNTTEPSRGHQGRAQRLALQRALQHYPAVRPTGHCPWYRGFIWWDIFNKVINMYDLFRSVTGAGAGPCAGTGRRAPWQRLRRIVTRRRRGHTRRRPGCTEGRPHKQGAEGSMIDIHTDLRP